MTPSQESNKGGEIADGLLSSADLQKAAVELCHAGLLTCTRGEPGDPGALYAVAWLPFEAPDQHPHEVRAQHAKNMRLVLNGVEPPGD